MSRSAAERWAQALNCSFEVSSAHWKREPSVRARSASSSAASCEDAREAAGWPLELSERALVLPERAAAVPARAPGVGEPTPDPFERHDTLMAKTRSLRPSRCTSK